MTTTVAAPVPVETVTPIKPSEALRLGRLTYPNGACAAKFDGASAACAIGAMHVGWGFPVPTGGDDDPHEFDAVNRLGDLGIQSPEVSIGSHIFDAVFHDTKDVHAADAAVLAYLESRGL